MHVAAENGGVKRRRRLTLSGRGREGAAGGAARGCRPVHGIESLRVDDSLLHLSPPDTDSSPTTSCSFRRASLLRRWPVLQDQWPSGSG
eukprot:3932698-Rhodomonas_salina.1